jgi:hypothetical protein
MENVTKSKKGLIIQLSNVTFCKLWCGQGGLNYAFGQITTILDVLEG